LVYIFGSDGARTWFRNIDVTSPMPRNRKVRQLDELAALLKDLKSEGKRIVHSHGVFDLLHVGHIRHFEEASTMGDVLVVTITGDEHVNKGPHRPTFPQDLRAEAIAALGTVDYVAINRWPLAVNAIKLLLPDTYVKGPDYQDVRKDITGGILEEAAAVKAVGGEIRFTDDVTFSSSSVLNERFSPYSGVTDRYLDDFRRRHSMGEVLGWLEQARSLRPLVIGEAIIDEYHFTNGIGKATKDPIVAVLHDRVETYAGGTLAIANHLAGLCDHVELVTQIGEAERRERTVRDLLKPNVRPQFTTKSGAPTIHKRRIVDEHSGNKLLEIYVMDDSPTGAADQEHLIDALDVSQARSDLIIVADYGHGMLTKRAIDYLCGQEKFLAINVQTNAGNRGFNPISKYRLADYVCLAGHEIQIETRMRDVNMQEGTREVLKRIECSRVLVTVGQEGILHLDATDGFTKSQALASHVLDKVGAGDAVLAVTSLLEKIGAPTDIIGFIGNVAGAHVVASLGNAVPLDRVTLSRHITSLLK